MKHKTSDQEFSEIVCQSTSLAQVITKCDLIPAGGNYATTKLRIANLKLDTSHFSGQAHNKGKVARNKKHNLSDYLTNRAKIPSHRLRQKLIEYGLKEAHCQRCDLAVWNGQAIALELHHIDGDRNNNAIENLEFLCPNCHAQTSTYRGKNKKK